MAKSPVAELARVRAARRIRPEVWRLRLHSNPNFVKRRPDYFFPFFLAGFRLPPPAVAAFFFPFLPKADSQPDEYLSFDPTRTMDTV